MKKGGRVNCVLFDLCDLTPEGAAILRSDDRRYQHIQKILKLGRGDSVKSGLIGGGMGIATIRSCDQREMFLDFVFDQNPPVSSPVTLVVALHRPIILKRVLLHATSLGVKKIYLIQTARVEKSFWKSSLLDSNSLKAQMVWGLEQCGDTILPEVFFRKQWDRFVEQDLPDLLKEREGFFAHPSSGQTLCCVKSRREVVVAIGPEGGFVDCEIQSFQKAGCRPLSLGERILRVETAVPVVLARFLS